MSQSFSHRRRHCAAALFALLASTAHADPLSNAISGGQVNLDFRPRYEFMSQANKNDAHAFTVQTLLGLASRPVCASLRHADYRRTSYGVNTEGAWIFVTAKF